MHIIYVPIYLCSFLHIQVQINLINLQNAIVIVVENDNEPYTFKENFIIDDEVECCWFLFVYCVLVLAYESIVISVVFGYDSGVADVVCVNWVS